jgi:hypothetical protein
MRTHHISVFGVATMVLILIATGLATRLAELALASAMRLTSVGGGALLSPQDLAGGDHRQMGWAFVRLLLPGILIQAVLVRIVVGCYRGLTIPFVATVAVLGLFDVGAIGLSTLVARFFADSRGLGALTATAPAAIYLAVAISAATLIAEAYLLQGLIEMPVGRYPVVARRA